MRHFITRLFVVALVVLVLPMAAFATKIDASGNSVQIVRVGYVENAGVIQTPIVNGSEGYGYEYLEKILEYTDGHYVLEYVACTRDTAYQMLANGEIDIYLFAGYNQEVADNGYIYTQNDFGNNILFLTSMSDITIDTDSYSKVDGSALGSIADDSYVQIFLDEYGIDATIIEIYDTDYEVAYQNYNLDFCVVSSLQFPDNDAINILAQIDVVPMYAVAMEENQALIDDIDQAMVQIERKEYHFQENTYLEYYDYDIEMDTYISSEEYALLQSQEIYTVGLRDLSGPFSKKNVNTTWSGVAIDYLVMLEEYAGISIQVVEIDDSTTAEELASLDFYLFPGQLLEADATESETYLSVPLILVDHAETIETASTVGILNYYGMDLGDAGEVFGRTAIEYANTEEMVAGMNSGEVESMIVTTATLNYIRTDLDDAAFLSTMLDSEVNLVMYYASTFSEEKIDIFNKIILNLDETTLEYSLLANATNGSSIDLVTYLEENPIILVSAVMFILLLAGIMDERRRRAILKQINLDALTGLASKHRFDKEVRVRLTSRLNLPGMSREYRLISLDIDNFKYINEIYGYDMGTRILKRISEMIKKYVPRDAIVTRTHADNFLIFMPKNKKPDDFSFHVAQSGQLNDALSSTLGTDYKFSFSVGIYDLPKAKVPINYMVDCANVARELGKSTVGTTIHKFSEEINVERAKNNEIAANMEQALATGEFLLNYQPKVDLKTNALVGAEALVRWKRGGKMIAPYHFIPLFEKNGFVQKLDLEVLRQTCEFIKKHEREGVPKISVNLSGVTLAKPSIVLDVTTILSAHGVKPEQVDIEITETAFVGNDTAQEVVTELEKIGFTISMDDFGAGISSLGRLKKLEIDTLKIDREFIVDYLGNEKGAVILKSMIGMARALGIETVAEGIETKEQMESLRRYGCDVGQGYYFSRPIPEDEFLAYCEHSAAQGAKLTAAPPVQFKSLGS